MEVSLKDSRSVITVPFECEEEHMCYMSDSTEEHNVPLNHETTEAEQKDTESLILFSEENNNNLHLSLVSRSFVLVARAVLYIVIILVQFYYFNNKKSTI